MLTLDEKVALLKEVGEELITEEEIRRRIEWKVDQGKIVILPVQKEFLKHRNRIKTGPAKIEDDIKLARQQSVGKFGI